MSKEKEKHDWIITFQNPIYEELKIRFCKLCGKMEVHECHGEQIDLQWNNITTLKEYLNTEKHLRKYAEKLKQDRVKALQEKIKEGKEQKIALKYLLERENKNV